MIGIGLGCLQRVGYTFLSQIVLSRCDLECLVLLGWHVVFVSGGLDEVPCADMLDLGALRLQVQVYLVNSTVQFNAEYVRLVRVNHAALYDLSGAAGFTGSFWRVDMLTIELIDSLEIDFLEGRLHHQGVELIINVCCEVNLWRRA